MFIKLIYSLFLLLFYTTVSYSKELKKVTLQLPGPNQFMYAGYYIAKEKGFYSALGLDVKILAFNKQEDIVTSVSKKEFDFSISGENLLISKNKNIVALYPLLQSSHLALISLKKSNINYISDFKDKKVLTDKKYMNYLSLNAMIKSFDIKKTNLKNITKKVVIEDLYKKDIDVLATCRTIFPYLLESNKIEYNIFSAKDYGFDVYDQYLYTSKELIKTNRILVDNFRKASLLGWEYAYSNINESVKLIKDKYNSQNLSFDTLEYEAKELKKLSYYRTSQLGEINIDRVENLLNLYSIMGFSSNRTKLNISIYNQYKNKKNKINFSQKELGYIKNAKTVRMCIVPNYLPLSSSKNNKFIGLDADFIKEIKEVSNLKTRLVKTKTWTQSLEYIKDDKCDILTSAIYTKERDSYLNFTSSYKKVTYVLTSKNTRNFIDDMTKLRNKKISILKNHAILKKVKEEFPNITFVEVEKFTHGLNLVETSKVFAHFGSLPTSLYQLQNSYYDKLKIVAKYDGFSNISIAIRKENKILSSILSKAVLSVDIKTRNKIFNSFMKIEYKEKFDYKLLAQLLLGFMFIIIFVLYKQLDLNRKNRLLQKQLEEKSKELIHNNSLLKERIKEEVTKNEKKNKILAQQSKLASMGEMIANIAHQWRQPLNNINLLIHYVRDNYDNKDFTKKDFSLSVHDISLQLNYMSKVIDDFRQFFKPKSKVESFALQNVFNKTLTLISAQIKNENIKIIYDIEDVYLFTLESELMQVIINLVNNAKYELISNNINEKYIFINAYKKKSKIVIKIKDNAGGIKEEIMQRIFEPYFTTKDEASGTGIGLYMSEEIVIKHMDGLIFAENETFTYENNSYKGAVFTIILPDAFDYDVETLSS